MYLLQVFNIATRSIVANKGRSLLTTLGIIIGIAAVIAMLSIGQGAQSSILEQVQGLGANTISVIPVQNFNGPQSRSSFESLVSNRLDREVVRKFNNKVAFPEITAIAPEISKSFEISYKAQTNFATVYGVNGDYFPAKDFTAEQGRVVEAADDARSRKVAVLGSSIAQKLFGEDDVIGNFIRINNARYEVIGVLTSKGAGSDNNIYVPLSTAASDLIGERDYSQLTLKIASEDQIDQVQAKVEQTLLDYYRIADPDKANFTVFTSKDLLALTESITGIFVTLLASVAGISLVVGGIGIMNIMLVSVTERTQEIGLRKAVGAKQNAILTQFLIEAIVLTLVGGLIGIVIGGGLALIVGGIGNIPVIISASSIALATSVSATIGVIFGFYPAYRAAKLNPIDALRAE